MNTHSSTSSSTSSSSSNSRLMDRDTWMLTSIREATKFDAIKSRHKSFKPRANAFIRIVKIQMAVPHLYCMTDKKTKEIWKVVLRSMHRNLKYLIDNVKNPTEDKVHVKRVIKYMNKFLDGHYKTTTTNQYAMLQTELQLQFKVGADVSREILSYL